MSESTVEGSTQNIMPTLDIPVQDILKNFRSLTDQDKQYFIDNIGSGVLDRVIKSVRQEEKNKLYPDLEKSREYNKKLQEELDMFKQSAQEQESLKMSEVESIKKKEAELMEEIQKQKMFFEQAGRDFEQKLKDAELKAFRAEAIKNHSVPKHLEQYVNGQSEADIEQAALKAVQTFNEMREAILSEAKVNSPVEMVQAQVVEKIPANPLPQQRMDTTFVNPSPDISSQQSMNNFTNNDIESMSLKDYANNREAIFSQLKDRMTGLATGLAS